MVNVVADNFMVFLLVFIRMTGMVSFNPVFGRRNIPVMMRIGLAFMLAITATALLPVYDPGLSNPAALGLAAAKELAVGFVIGYVMNIATSVIISAGDIIDNQMGLSMAKIYDPASNIQMALSASFMNVLFFVMLFLTNGHLSIIRITVLSFNILPPGIHFFSSDIAVYAAHLFTQMLVYALKLALPVIAAELLAETGVGILMRAVPQINVFVVGIQLRVLAGLLVMVILCPVIGWFMDGMLADMLTQLEQAILAIAGV